MILGHDDSNERVRRDAEAAFIVILCKDNRRLLPQERDWIIEWIQQSSDNVASLLHMLDVDQELDRWKLRDRGAQLSASRPAERRIRWIPRAVLGGVTAIALSFWMLSTSTIGGREPAIRRVTLDDGSVAHILRGSDFRAEFSGEIRLINLPYGEAVFEVAKDPGRPFIVRSQNSDSIAVGTRFGVAAHSDATTTTVSEGEVHVVVPAGADRQNRTLVGAGEELRVVAGALRPQPVLAVKAEKRISWAAGWLEFEGETAGDAVQAFNRFIDARIEITQPELSNARLGYGRFEIDKPDSFAIAVGAALNAPVTWNSKRTIIYIGGNDQPE